MNLPSTGSGMWWHAQVNALPASLRVHDEDMGRFGVSSQIRHKFFSRNSPVSWGSQEAEVSLAADDVMSLE